METNSTHKTHKHSPERTLKELVIQGNCLLSHRILDCDITHDTIKSIRLCKHGFKHCLLCLMLKHKHALPSVLEALSTFSSTFIKSAEAQSQSTLKVLEII